ncbi:lytic murein transglycosylase [Lichenihabitans psoromatis]|uniref:lytic murein transglycosylase n=1 Tax=Lichenihabitans psoromatis TaxID=2528642 RepID=UPI001FDFB2B9|nr:lytic murein transglycosylase [Lichenihabitans psoromatis]
MTIDPRKFGAFAMTSSLRALAGAMALALGFSAAAEANMVVRPSHAALQSRTQSFESFVASLWPEASRRGVSRATFDAAMAGVTLDPAVIDKTRKQAEFVKPVGDYLTSAVSQKRIETGRSKARDWEKWIVKAENDYGVDRYIVLGVWGLETNFGGFAGNDYVVRSLATLAYQRYRGNYFRKELIAALVILQERNVDPAHMLGSWAGAMGQTQFMPTSFKTYAVDFDGDGRRDIWTSVPDAIGSTANYLHKHHWIPGETWGYEVQLPNGFGHPGEAGYKSFASWGERGVQRADGGEMPRSGKAELLMPAGAGGPAFLVTPNFKVIKSYNNSTAYALGVALLSDRIAGWGPLKGQWPMASR